MLIKSNLLGLGLASLAHFFGPRSMAGELRNKLIVGMLFMLGFTCPFSAWAVRNQTVPAAGFDGMNQVRVLYHLPEPKTRIELLGEHDFSIGLGLGKVF
jgi:hypothetical protein